MHYSRRDFFSLLACLFIYTFCLIQEILSLQLMSAAGWQPCCHSDLLQEILSLHSSSQALPPGFCAFTVADACYWAGDLAAIPALILLSMVRP